MMSTGSFEIWHTFQNILYLHASRTIGLNMKMSYVFWNTNGKNYQLNYQFENLAYLCIWCFTPWVWFTNVLHFLIFLFLHLMLCFLILEMFLLPWPPSCLSPSHSRRGEYKTNLRQWKLLNITFKAQKDPNHTTFTSHVI